MPTFPTPIATSERHTSYGNLVVYYLAVIAAATRIPTRAEITAGKDLTGEIADMSGWTITGAEIEAPDLKSSYTKKVRGRTSSEDSSLTFYRDRAGVDVRTVLPYKAVGYILFLDGGDVPTQPMDIHPISVRNGGGKTRSVGDELARLMVQFTITGEPVLDAPIPANP